jgi:predicted nucleic acid-binding protein
MRWVERDVQSPEERDVRVGEAVDGLIQAGAALAVSEVTLVEFRVAVVQDVRREHPQKAGCDAAWAARARTKLMERMADGRITVVPVPLRAFEHAMTLVDMAARDHNLGLRTFDAIHLITACAWAHAEGATVRLYTTDHHFEDFTAVYPHFERFAEIIHLDLTTRS